MDSPPRQNDNIVMPKDIPFSRTVSPNKPSASKEIITYRIGHEHAHLRDRKLTDASAAVDPRKKMILIAATVGLVAFLALIGTVIALQLEKKGDTFNQWQDDFCDKVAKYARNKKLEGSGLTKLPEVVDINKCRQNFDCSFDITSCSSPCPLGHEKELECATSCRCAVRGRMQMDIQFNEATIPVLLEQTSVSAPDDFPVLDHASIKLWDEDIVDGRPQIPYEMDVTLDSFHRDTVLEAFEVFREETCIDFVERTSQEDYLHFQNGEGDCSSSYSHMSGRNDINVKSCYSSSHVTHILMHALGYHHEHTRDDRDAFLTIKWENVYPEHSNALKKLSHEYLPFVTEFDKRSVMMLDGYAFSKDVTDKTQPTMIDRATSMPAAGGQSTFTPDDIVNIAVVYCRGVPESRLADSVGSRIAQDPISATFATAWTEWTQWTDCLETCGASSSTRHRICQLDTGFVAYGCKGANVDSRYCFQQRCQARTAYWDTWGEFGECSKSCGGGIQLRSRVCSEMNECSGDDVEARECNTQVCPVDVGVWSTWTGWGDCDATCGHGYRQRRRECLSLIEGGVTCAGTVNEEGFGHQVKECVLPSCALSRSDESREGVPNFFTQMVHENTFNATGIQMDACKSVPTEYWFTGDFNGDRATDILCGESVDHMQIYVSTRDGRFIPQWHGRLNCEIDFIYVGDFNGDGISDLFCKDSLLSRNFIYTAMTTGSFTRHIDAGPFCMSMYDIIQIADMNGDGKDDVICRHAQLGGDTDVYISSLNKIGKFDYH